MFFLQLVRVAARDVDYTFEVSYFKVDPDNHGIAWVQGVNGTLPGPAIRVTNGDRLRVHIINTLQTEEVSFHWHGFEMRHAQEYDGVVGVTQCGIKPQTTFTYDWVVNEHPGTYMYHEHAHHEHVAARGLFGAIIVDPQPGNEPFWYADYDQEETLLLHDWWVKSPHDVDMGKWAGLTRPNTVSKDYNDVGLQPFENVLINGKGAYAALNDLAWESSVGNSVSQLATIVPRAGETWRLRVVNGGSLFALRFRIDGHRLRVVQADGADVEPYNCDVLSMSAGERFDVLVTFNGDPGSYWMRTETLEDHYGWQHGQLGVVRYAGTPNVAPDKGYPRSHRLDDAPELVTINCVDQGPMSPTCRPITDLRRAGGSSGHGHTTSRLREFEVNFRGYGKPDDSHLTRVLDLNSASNEYGDDQYDGEYVQFMPPHVPYTHVGGTGRAEHPNTLKMHVGIGDTVRVILQTQDRVAHPWHLHGHKFAVISFGFPDYTRDCDILHCTAEHNRWISRDGMPDDALDPAVAPLKDTVHVPAGGWAVIQFEADNPGVWFFHCHMKIHVHDGMGLLLIEGSASELPDRFVDSTYLEEERGFPSCDDELHHLEKKGPGLACPCWENPETYLDNGLRANYRCSRSYLCGLEITSLVEPQEESRLGARNRGEGRPWRIGLVVIEGVIVGFFFFAKRWIRRHQSQHAEKVATMVTVVKQALRLAKLNTNSGVASTPSSQAKFGRRSSGISLSRRPSGTSARRMSAQGGPEGIAAAWGGDAEQAPASSSRRRSTSARSSISSKSSTSTEDKGLGLTELPSAGLSVSWDVQLAHLGMSSSESDDGVESVTLHQGHIPSGSVLALLGKPLDIEPWLEFFAGRVGKHAAGASSRVNGSLTLGDKPSLEWRRNELRQVRGYIDEVKAFRASCTVAEVLDLQLKLTTAPNLYKDPDQRIIHLAKYVNLFRLDEVLDQRLGSLSQEVLMRVAIAKELLLPRAVLIIKDPLEHLGQQGSGKIVSLFKLLSKKIGVTVIFSCSSVSGKACDSISHMLVTGSRIDPVAGDKDEIDAFCKTSGTERRPRAVHPFDWCSQLLFRGEFDGSDRAAAEDDNEDGGTPGLPRAQFDDTPFEAEDEEVMSNEQGAAVSPPPVSHSEGTAALKDGTSVADPVQVISGDAGSEEESPDAPAPPKVGSHAAYLAADDTDLAAPNGFPPELPNGVPKVTPADTSSTLSSILPVKVAPQAPSFGDSRGSRTLLTQLGGLHAAAAEGSKTLFAARSAGTNTSVDYRGKQSNSHLQRTQRSFLWQCYVLWQYEQVSNIEESVTVYRLVETFGLGIAAGFVWFRVASVDLQTSLGESVGLFFFSTALWTVPPVFQAMAAAPFLVARASGECLGGLYSPAAFVVASSISNAVTLAVWVCAWQVVAYSLADLGASWHSMLAMHVLLFLNAFAMRTVGSFLGLVIPSSMLNVVVGNLFAQMCMLTNGFYTKLPGWMNWITIFSIPRYTFRALLKLEYAWTDTFEVHPMLGAAGAGFPTRFIPAEMTGVFQLMKHKGMGIMQSPYDATVIPETAVLIGIAVSFSVMVYLGLRYRVGALERKTA